MSTDPLAPEHRQMLENASGISPEVILSRGYVTVTNKRELAELGSSPAQRHVPGLLLPLHATDGSQPTCQYRPDSPRTSRGGKPVKYETPQNAGIRIDCSPLVRPQLRDPSIPLWITEGIKKGDALASQGECALALIGVWGFKGKNALGGTTILADLDYVAWNERPVLTVFDSDVMTKGPVQQALDRLTEILRRKAAQVRNVILSGGPNGEKVGIDDFLAAGHSVQELRALAQEPASRQSDRLPLVIDQLPDAPVSPQAQVPPPFRLRSTGLFSVETATNPDTGAKEELEVSVAPAPVVLTCRHQDVDSNEYDLELSWLGQRGWENTTLRRDVVADHRKLPSAALSGFPVTSLNARTLTLYLAAYEHLNREAMPRSLVTRRCGWREIDGRLGFVLGARIIGIASARAFRSGSPTGDLLGEDALQLLTDTGTANLASALHSRGSREGWLEAMSMVSNLPRIMIGVYTSLTSPMLHILGASNFMLDYCGDTSIGKTTSQDAAASVWGLPSGNRGGLVLAWNATQVFVERYAELLNDLPMILEDSQTGDPKALARSTYMLANGVGRGRGSPRGLRGVTRWRGITISSGERPLHEVTQLGGSRARIITLWGSPFGSGDQGPLVRQFRSQIAENYGHAGPAFVSWLLAHRQQWLQFRESYQELTGVLARDFPGNVGDRHAGYFAVLLVTATLATPVLGLPGDPEALIHAVMEELSQPQEDADTALRALVDFIGWAVGSQALFEGKDDPEHPLKTYLGRWEQGHYIAVFPHQARSQLARMGYSPEASFRSWRDRSWLMADRDRFTHRLRVLGVPQHMIALDWAAVMAATAPQGALVP